MKEPRVTVGFLAPSQCEKLIEACEAASFSVDPNPEYLQATTGELVEGKNESD